MGTIDQPAKAHIKELTRVEIETILSRNHVGRVAFSFRDRVDIRPIHYVYKNGWIYGCTSKGGKLETIAHNMWVAFEVDEVAGTFDWRSIVIRGAFYIMSPIGSLHPDPTDTSGTGGPGIRRGRSCAAYVPSGRNAGIRPDSVSTYGVPH